MFAFRGSKPSQKDVTFEVMSKKREEIKRKLEEVERVNSQLEIAVSETKQLSVDLVGKLKKELKVAKKSLTSITKKLHEGVLLVDHQGNVIQLNKTGEKLLGIEEGAAVGKRICDVINQVADGENEIRFSPSFFAELSQKIIDQASKFTNGKKFTECNRVFKEALPGALEPEVELQLDADVCGRKVKLTFMFSLLDNDPESLSDLTYVFLFHRNIGMLSRFSDVQAV